ncbi:MAG: sugar phosphate nucleotidyltransferase [Chloroflexi bacterium]|nr:sugar phosphate nucleotidyltransferase [Chloroflexota bacterium]
MLAVVMAGGEGSRLRPLTLHRPKPMVPILNIPVMQHIINLLKQHNITDIVVTVHYLASVIEEYFGDGSDFGVHIRYALEETPLGTAGSVKNARQYLTEPFLIISGDAITDINLSKVIRFHEERKAKATIVLVHVENPLEYGVVITDEEGHVQRFLEKPSWGEVFSDTVNTGIYLLDPSVLDLIPEGKPFDFSSEVFPQLLARGDKMVGYVADGYWCDVGSLPDYLRASFDLAEGRVNLPLPHPRQSQGIAVGKGATIEPGVLTFGVVYLGDGCVIRSGAVLHGPTVIGENSIVESGATIDRSVIWNNCLISNNASINGAIIAKQCSIRRSAIIAQGVVIGDGCTIGERAVIHSNVKIWPDKEVEEQATVSSSLIWGGRARRSLFAGHATISGLANVELTPELAAKVGAAYGSMLPAGSAVLVNRGHSKAARMIKRGIVSGLPSAGIDVIDTSSVAVPVARYETREGPAKGGIHVRMSPYDARVVDIKLFDANGADVSKNTERKIANIYLREDVRRVPADTIGAIYAGLEPQQRAEQRYRNTFLKHVNRNLIEKAQPTIIVDFSNGLFAPLGQRLLREIGINLIELNAITLESEPRLEEKITGKLRTLGAVTRAVGARFGVLFNYSGTRLTVVDELGGTLPSWHALAVMMLLSWQHAAQAVPVGLPLTAPRLIETLSQYDGHRVQVLAPDPVVLSGATMRQDLALIGDGAGGFAFPELPSGFDALFTTVHLLELLLSADTPLSKVAAQVPPYHLHSIDAYCPWERKGKVMRRLHETAQETGGRSLQGVRLASGEDTIVIVPDADKPLFHVQAEAQSPQHAAALAEHYVDMIRTYGES